MSELDHKELRYNLQSLFLCCGSIMAAAIEALVRSYRFKIAIEVSGSGNPGYGLFVRMAEKLNIPLIETPIKTSDTMKNFAWISDQTVKCQRAWICGMDQREGDLHVMLPFYLKYHLNALRIHDPEFRAPKVDNLYIMLIWSEHFRSNRGPLSNRIMKDLIAWEAVGRLTAHRYAGTIQDEIRSLYRRVEELPDLAQLYLGFGSGAEGVELAKSQGMSRHAFNVWADQMAFITVPGPGSTPVRLPRLVRQYSWEIGEVTVITKGAWTLYSHGAELAKNDLPKVRHCLIDRLKGLNESDICTNLAFDSKDAYYKWQVSRGIDIDPRRLTDPYSDWLKACNYFGIEPNAEVLDQSATDIYGNVKDAKEDRHEDSSPLGPGNGQSGTHEFRHSPDFRTVVAVSGKQFTLTPKQAHVVQLLFDAQENGTPFLSHGYLVESVFGEVAENNLKKLFADNDAWNNLMEPSKRRGVVRLRVKPTTSGK